MAAFHAYVVYGGSEEKMAQAIVKANRSAANYKPKYDHGEKGKTGMQWAIIQARGWKNNHFPKTLGLISVELINDTCGAGKSQHEVPKTEEKTFQENERY